LNKIKAIAMDVDGVLTDGTFIWGTNGAEYKSFSFLDIMGISLGLRAGLIFAFISGENSPLIDRIAEKMAICDVYKGCKDKAKALKNFAQKYDLELAEVCFIGDDVNDVPALELAGLAVAPATAHATAQNKASLVTKCGGGQGAIRELVDMILTKRNGQ
jgi:3-deoxy-D-manno-octulosonate 8-phosphate phosphatase (KDO 8-P phosphatase)